MSEGQGTRPTEPAVVARWRHYGGFLLGGGVAFLIDAALLEVLIRFAAMSPFAARPVSIAAAMLASWWINRTVTFAVAARPSLAEFGRFAAVSWVSQAVNYAVFALILVMVPRAWPIVALFVACLVSMIVSYAGFRFGVFRSPGNGASA